jgi:uncharacterized protein (DUF2062 family)
MAGLCLFANLFLLVGFFHRSVCLCRSRRSGSLSFKIAQRPNVAHTAMAHNVAAGMSKKLERKKSFCY